MADTRKIPTGRTTKPTAPRAEDARMQAVGDDLYASDQGRENFQPRNAGEVEDSVDQAAARVAKELREEASRRDEPRPDQDTSFEARTERGEEWIENTDTDPTRRHDINQDVYPREAPANEPDER